MGLLKEDEKKMENGKEYFLVHVITDNQVQRKVCNMTRTDPMQKTILPV